jgi:hypothetical protein
MKLIIISMIAYMITSVSVADPISDRMSKLSASTVCMVVNSFYVRDISMFAIQYGIAIGSIDLASMEKEILAPAREKDLILSDHSQKLIKELVSLGASADVIGEHVQNLISTETADNIRSWLQVDDVRSAHEHLLRLATKNALCDAHYKKVKGQPI